MFSKTRKAPHICVRACVAECGRPGANGLSHYLYYCCFYGHHSGGFSLFFNYFDPSSKRTHSILHDFFYYCVSFSSRCCSSSSRDDIFLLRFTAPYVTGRLEFVAKRVLRLYASSFSFNDASVPVNRIYRVIPFKRYEPVRAYTLFNV